MLRLAFTLRNCLLEVFAIGLLIQIARAQPPDCKLRVERSGVTGLASFVAADDGGPITRDAGGVARAISTPDEFLRLHGGLFGVTDPQAQLLIDHVRRDEWNESHSTFCQVHRGVPVFSGVIRVHQDSAGRVVAANGDFNPIDAQLDVRPSLPSDAAVMLVSAEVESGQPVVEKQELVVVDPGWYGDPSIGATLAYHIVISDAAAGLREAFFVHARTGKILDRWSLIERLIDRQIHDGMSTSELPGTLARAEGDPPYPEQDDVNRAYDYFGDTYDYFQRAFGRDGIDDRGLPMIATVNSRAPGCPNAFWSDHLLQMAFCKFTVTDDITAHELAHGVTTFSADLIYQNQSGQLNESFSDVFGELVDLFNGNAAFIDPFGPPWPVHPTGGGADAPNIRRTQCSPRPTYPDGVRWLVAEDSVAFGGAIRDMWDPTCRGHPDRANSELQTCGPGDNGGVHSGSGIPNHAFAILVDGKTFNGFTVRGIGPIKAGAVWYRALTVYLTPASDFEDAYLALTRSARDLIGRFVADPRTGRPMAEPFTEDDALQVDLALQAVEMNTPGRCGRTIAVLDPRTPRQCGRRVLLFQDGFESTQSGWTTAHTDSPTPYDWVISSEPLPHDRPGRAWFCADPDLGDCDKVDESALHSLISPPIQLPATLDFPLLRFTHYLDTELGYDGGNVSIRANGGSWRLIRGIHFQFNPYNSALRAGRYNNTSPLAGQEAWNGVGGRWGTSVINLRPYVKPGDLIEIRFDFGKDGCTGRRGWYVDDVEIYDCPDCNRNGLSDEADLQFVVISPMLGNIGVNSPQSHTFSSLPPATGDVFLRMSAIADLFGELRDESLFISLNGDLIGEVFVDGASDCPRTPDVTELIIPMARFNAAVENGQVRFDVVATSAVNPTACGGSSWVRLALEYATATSDQDHDDVPDECQFCRIANQPLPTTISVATNRYISFVPRSASRTVAYRVRVANSPAGAGAVFNSVYWVGPPRSQGPGGQGPAGGRHARLQCNSFFSASWPDDQRVVISGPEVRPGAIYRIDAIDLACAQDTRPDLIPRAAAMDDRYFSAVLTVPTVSVWGDVVGSSGSPEAPDGKVDMADMTAVVDRFVNQPDAVSTERADLHPAVPNYIVDFQDIAGVLDAYRGFPYPFSSGPRCPK